MPEHLVPESGLAAEAALWVARRRNGGHDVEEQRHFMRWLNASPANREAYDRAEAVWQELGGLDQIADRQLAEARAYLRSARRQPAWGRWAVAAAACFAAVLVWQIDPFSYLDDQTYRTARGQLKTIDLADGSRLELDTDSEARVHYSRRDREIRLVRGRAVFAVAHDDRRPFEVLAGLGKIRDIGTEFDVRHAADGVSVAVLDGEVQVAGVPDATPVPVHRGQKIGYRPSGELTPVRPIDVNAYSAWRNGRLVFRDQPLREVLEELGRYHRSNVTVTAPGVLDTKVSGIFPTDNLPQAMQTIAATLPVRLTRLDEQSWRIDPR